MQAIDQSAADRRPDPQGAYFDGALREEITAPTAAGGIIGASAGLREVLERLSRVAATDSTVLITGETGTGKELIARAIHAGSPRARRALV
jgi:formate hydrogenlyase transcriptional activator